MNKHQIRENEFYPAPGGTSGTVNYQYPLGTHTSPNVIQDPDKFYNSNNNKALGTNSNTSNNNPDSEKDIKNDIETIYSKKKVPTADQIKAGYDYELHNMIKPDKAEAKRLVLQNLKKDPDYYGKLHHLNIDDDNMKVDLKEFKEKNIDLKETGKIFADLINKKGNKYVVNSAISDVMKEMWDKKQQRKMWSK